MIFNLLILLAIFTFSSGSTLFRHPLRDLNHINSLRFTPQSLRSDLNSLDEFFSLIVANMKSPEIRKELSNTLFDSVNECYYRIKRLYEEKSVKFIRENIGSDSSLKGFFFYLGNIRFFEAKSGKPFRDNIVDVSFDFVNSFIWGELKNPVSSADPWQDRALRAESHIGILKRIRKFYYPIVEVNMTENGISTQRSMREFIKRLEFIVHQFKLHKGRIENSDLVKSLEIIINLKCTPQSSRSDFESLCKFYHLIDANKNSYEIHRVLWNTFNDSANDFYSQMKKFYEKDPTKFIIEVADSDPFLMGFLYYREEGFGTAVYFLTWLGKITKFELDEVSFYYVNDFIWKEFKKPISSVDPLEDRILRAKAQIGVLKRVQVIYYPVDKVKIIENGIYSPRSMRGIIKRLEFIITEFKLQETKIGIWDLVKVCGKIQSLYHKLNGIFDETLAGPYLDLFKLFANHFMITPNDENILITLHPKILCLCSISYNNQNDKGLFSYFGQSDLNLMNAAFELIPERFISLIDSFNSQSPTVLSEQDHWQIKVYSRLKYLKRVNKKI
jgi:hypothetical protein